VVSQIQFSDWSILRPIKFRFSSMISLFWGFFDSDKI
jgi:hypothetical protein